MTGRIFLCYAREDRKQVLEIYTAFRRAGLRPWMDKPPQPYQLEGIQPGQLWATAISETIAQASYFLAFLSKASVSKRGFVQREYRLALQNMNTLPQGKTFLIPVLLESDCPLPDTSVESFRFSDLQWFDLEVDGLDTLISFLRGELVATPPTIEQNQPVEIAETMEFLTSIGSNRTLKLLEKAYLITPEMAEFRFSEHVSVEKNHDGWQFYFKDIENLKIVGINKMASQVIVNSRYSFVLAFKNCKNIALENITLSHSPPGYCRGGVVYLNNCNDIAIRSCNLYGCGTEGLYASQVEGLTCEDVRISDCTYGIMRLRRVSKARFANCLFRDNKEFWGINVDESENVWFDQCQVYRNISKNSPLLAIHPDSKIVWKGGEIKFNTSKGLYYFSSTIDFDEANVENNYMSKD